MLTPGQDRQLKAWLKEHFKKHGCANCGSRTWGIHAYVSMPIRVSAFTPTDMLQFADSLNRNVIPCAALACQKCGLVQFVSLLIAGVLDRNLQPLPGLPAPAAESTVNLDDEPATPKLEAVSDEADEPPKVE
jgi:hypothetical protein